MCPLGSTAPIICPGGTYQNEIGRSTCKTCPAGFTCGIGTVTPTELCPIGQYCPPGSHFGTYCANGTYGESLGMLSQSECTACPATKYCQHGEIVANCSAGYFCKIGQGDPTPQFNVSRYPSSQGLLGVLQTLDGGPCFPGHYCPEGTQTPVACTNGTVRADPYGAQDSDCTACPGGFTCEVGNPVPFDCPTGKYCPVGLSAIDCPIGTYNSLIQRDSLDDCLSCDAGNFCSEPGITRQNNYPCPTGKFCLRGTVEPIDCPGGTYRNILGASRQSECFGCPPGRYCPIGSTIFLTCPAGYFCEAAVADFTICPAGSYCPTNTSVPITCPESHYCPIGTIVPIPCYYGTYCPAGTDFPISCPLGYRAVRTPNDTLSVLDSLENACVECPPGHYGSDPDRLVCSIGTPGYYFLGGTTSPTPRNETVQRGGICPVGHYCPAATVTPFACPAGTYQPDLAAKNISDCLACEEDTYQFNTGSASCFRCSSSSTADAGSNLCSCTGQNRIFQPEDGYCICRPGYEFVDNDLQTFTEEDGDFDCQPIVRPLCSSTQTRIFDGSCADDATYCDSFCSSAGGTIGSAGVCICDDIATLDEVCDESCRNSVPSVTCNSAGELEVTFPGNGGETVTLDRNDFDSVGEFDCSTAGSNVYSMSCTNGRFEGFFGLGAALEDAVSRRRRRMMLEDEFYTNASSTARGDVYYKSYFTSGMSAGYNYLDRDDIVPRLLQDNSSSSTPAMENPLVSISVGDSIIFDVSNDDYPVYEKDSLLNDNDDFDYSEFRKLREVARSSSRITTFTFTFNEDGTYVFSLKSDPDFIFIIAVLKKNVARSTDAVFVDFSNGNLVSMGVKSNDSIVVAPDWNLVIGLLLGMLALVVLVIAFLYYFRKQAWSHHTHINPKYRAKNMTAGFEKKGKGGTADAPKPGLDGVFGKRKNKVFAGDADAVASEKEDVEAAALADDDDNVDFDDDMLIPELAKHMQTHHDEIDRQLVNQTDMLNSLQDTLKKEVDELKNLLSATAMELQMNSGPDGKNKRLYNLLVQLKTDVLARGMYDSEADTNHKRVLSLVERMKKLLDEGTLKLASNIVLELVQEAVDMADHDEVVANIRSAILKDLIDDLEEVKDYVVNVILKNVADEKRRERSVEETFDNGIKNLRDAVFPSDVMEKLKFSRDADLETDTAFDDIVSVFRSFSDHIPQFVGFMNEAEGSLVRGLARTVDKGNQSMIEREQGIGTKNFSTFLDDLYEAMKVLVATVSDRMDSSGLKREEGVLARDDLIAAIDAALGELGSGAGGAMAESDIQQLLAPLLAALKGGRALDLLAADAALDAAEMSRDGSQADDFEEESLNEKFLDAVTSSENLTEEQKGNILDSAEADMKVMDSIIDLERKKQEEAIQKAIQFNAAAADGDAEGTVEESKKHESEQQELKASLAAAREAELQRIKEEEMQVAAEAAGGDETTSLKPKQLESLLKARMAVAMRHWSAEARIAYKELHMRFQVERVKVQLNMYDSSSPISAEVGLSRLNELTASEQQEMESLSESLANQLKELEQAEEQVRSKWTVYADDIDIEEETGALRKENKKKFSALKSRLQELGGVIRDHCKQEGVLSLASLASQKEKLQGEVYTRLIETARQKVELARDTVEKLQEQDLRIFQTEQAQLFEIIDRAASWSMGDDERAAQSQLHLRVLSGLHVNTNINNRLTMVEFELRSEIAQIKATTELTKRGAARDEIERKMEDLSKAKSSNASKLAAALNDRLNTINRIELDRQQEAPIFFEKERARAIEQNALREVKVALQMYRSIRNIQRDVRSALAEKKAALMTDLKGSAVSEEIKQLTVKEIEAETIREDLDLKVAYDSFEEGYAISERYLCEAVQGLEPSTPYISMLVRLFNTSELHLLHESTYMEDERKRLRKRIEARKYREFEEVRLQRLSRATPEALEAMRSDVEAHEQKELQLIDAATLQETTRLQQLYKSRLEEKLAVHSGYEAEVAEAVTSYEQEKSLLRTSYEHQRQSILDSVEDDAAAERAVYENETKFSADLVHLELKHTQALFDIFKRIMTTVVSEESTEDELRSLRQRLSKETEALEGFVEASAANVMEDLIQTQTHRRSEEARAYADADEPFDARSAELTQKEDDEARQMRADLMEKEQAMLSAGGAAREEILNAASGASKAVKSNTEEELKNLRAQFEQEIVRLENDLQAKADKQRRDLAARLLSKKKARMRELQQQGKSEAEAADVVEAETADAMRELENAIEAEATAAVSDTRKQQAEAERKLIEAEFERATRAAANAQRVKDLAQEQMQRIRDQHASESKQLEQRMQAERKQQESALKARLAEKRKNKLREAVDDASRQQVEVELQKEEKEQLLEIQRQAVEEEKKMRERQRQEQEQAMQEVYAQLKKAEMEAAAAAAKEAAVKQFKELQAQAEEDVNMEEVQRMRNLHAVQEEKNKAELDRQKKANKGKLEERLALKRAKRERELQEQEERALRELEQRQKREAEEKEKNRLAKMAWTERVSEVIASAKQLGMSDHEREDYCFQETLGKQLVPEQQLTEAVGMIQKERHDREMTELLTANFEERVDALRKAVARVIEEKSQTKVELMDSLVSNGASEESIKKAVQQLDAEYNQKQLEVERTVTSKLEPGHIRNQMNLRQKQLQEMANVVALYTDPSSLQKLQQAAGKSQEEELRAYRERIEEEKRARAAELERERRETEERLRAQLQSEVDKIQQEIDEQQRKAEAEFERRKREVERQREELQKKQTAEMGEMDKAEKARIMETFEKEQAAALDALDAERKKKKDKLADRLNRRRSTQATKAPPALQQQQSKASLALSSLAELGAAAGGSSSASLAPTEKPTPSRAHAHASTKSTAFHGHTVVEPSAAFTQSIQLIESKLERIEKVISTLEKNGVKATMPAPMTPAHSVVPGSAHERDSFTTPLLPPAAIPAFHDRDEPVPGDTLEVLPDSEIQMQEMARLEFGKRLATMIGLKSLTLKPASSLPPSQASNNAFANSYYYISNDDTLLVHQNRLSSSGDFGLVVIHALSHIKVSAAPFTCCFPCVFIDDRIEIFFFFFLLFANNSSYFM